MDIYLDNAATTRVCPEAADMAYRVMTEQYGNPSSTHARGREAKKLLDAARRELALCLGCQPKELAFTSCGSESDNWAIKGAAHANASKGKHIITTVYEHHAVLHTMDALKKEGFEITYLKVDSDGQIKPEELEAAIRPIPSSSQRCSPTTKSARCFQ